MVIQVSQVLFNHEFIEFYEFWLRTNTIIYYEFHEKNRLRFVQFVGRLRPFVRLIIIRMVIRIIRSIRGRYSYMRKLFFNHY